MLRTNIIKESVTTFLKYAVFFFQMFLHLSSPLFPLIVSTIIATVSSQSNYANQANNIEYPVEGGLPEQATLDGKVTQLDDLSPVIFLNRTKAALNCASGSMQVELKFNDKFYGIAYADFDRNSACKLAGKGALSYQLELPLKGCGTKQVSLDFGICRR